MEGVPGRGERKEKIQWTEAMVRERPLAKLAAEIIQKVDPHTKLEITDDEGTFMFGTGAVGEKDQDFADMVYALGMVDSFLREGETDKAMRWCSEKKIPDTEVREKVWALYPELSAE